jgi:hypothetical protein
MVKGTMVKGTMVKGTMVKVVVSGLGFEPRTSALKGRCSTD